jgi:predicted nuclease with RNAse H fold
MDVIFGIDYGSKLSGQTVIAGFRKNEIFFLDVGQKVDADLFIKNAVEHFKPALVFLDAPLSFPGVYYNLQGFSDYHFRRADRETQAMSPMFLGGLAARAMELRAILKSQDIEVKETYPKIMAQRFKLKDFGYKSSKSALKECALRLKECIKDPLHFDASDIKTWHHLDALLALMSALSYRCGDFSTFGDAQEGQIFV